MKAPMLGLIVATAACGASALYLWQQLHAEREQASIVEQSMRQLQARVAELEQARGQFAQRRMAGAPGLVGGRFGQGAAPPPPPVTAVSPEFGPDSQRWEDARQPQRSATFKKVMRAQFRASNKQMLADVIAELSLDKETADKLIDLMTSQQVAAFEEVPAEVDPANLPQRFEDIQRQNEAAIAALLGPEKAQKLNEYQQSMPARSEFEMLARQLEANDMPLSAEQSRKLLAAYVDEHRRSPMPVAEPQGGSMDNYIKAYGEWEADYSRRLADAAVGILDAEQITMFRDNQQWQQEMRAQASPMFFRSTGGGNLTVSGAAVPFGATATMTLVAPTPAPPPKADEARKP